MKRALLVLALLTLAALIGLPLLAQDRTLPIDGGGMVMTTPTYIYTGTLYYGTDAWTAVPVTRAPTDTPTPYYDDGGMTMPTATRRTPRNRR